MSGSGWEKMLDLSGGVKHSSGGGKFPTFLYATKITKIPGNIGVEVNRHPECEARIDQTPASARILLLLITLPISTVPTQVDIFHLNI